MPNAVPNSEPKAQIANGTLIIDADSVRSILWTLQQNRLSDPDLDTSFKADPGKVLGQLGLSLEIQNEVLSGMGIAIPEGCWWSCVVTSIKTK
jgi:hypothetical protein